MPSTADVRELLLFLAANADVAHADGEHAKVDTYRRFQATVQGLADHADDLSAVTRIDIVSDRKREVLRGSDLFERGCVLDVQDDGRTLKILPPPA
jgi:hypothetical protein